MKTYIIPQTIVIKVQTHHALMQMSIYGSTSINADNAGLVKGNDFSSSSYSVWDEDWSATED